VPACLCLTPSAPVCQGGGRQSRHGSSPHAAPLLTALAVAGGRDEFDSQLASELLTDVKSMRQGLAAYLDQLGSYEGPDAGESGKCAPPSSRQQEER